MRGRLTLDHSNYPVSVSYRLTSPLLGDGSGFQAVFALCSFMRDSFWMLGNIDLVAKGSNLGLRAGHSFWPVHLVTYS